MNTFSIRIASKVIEQGGIIAYPTEAVFGLGCDPMNAVAVNKLMRLKKRSPKKGLILVASEFSQITPYIAELSPQLFNKVMKTWPGPVNWLLPINPNAPCYLRGMYTLQAIRISNHPIVHKLCQQFGGAIVSTSANYTRRQPALSALQVRLQFKHNIDYIINAPVGNQKQPCEIRNALDDQLIRI